MITNFLLDIAYVFVAGIARVVANFGSVSENNAITTAIVSFRSYYMSIEEYIPIVLILEIVAFILAFELVYGTYKLIRWGYRKVPFLGLH